MSRMPPRRPFAFPLSLVTALTLTLVTSACAPEPGQGSSPAPAETPKPTTTETPAPEPSAEPTETGPQDGWKRFDGTGVGFGFDYPSGWSLNTSAAVNNAGTEVTSAVLRDASGRVALELTTPADLLAPEYCDALSPVHVLEEEPMELSWAVTPENGLGVTPRFSYRALEADGQVLTQLGLTTTGTGEAAESCGFLTSMQLADGTTVSFADSPDPLTAASAGTARSFPSLTKATTFATTKDYATLKQVLLSVTQSPAL